MAHGYIITHNSQIMKRRYVTESNLDHAPERSFPLHRKGPSNPVRTRVPFAGYVPDRPRPRYLFSRIGASGFSHVVSTRVEPDHIRNAAGVKAYGSIGRRHPEGESPSSPNSPREPKPRQRAGSRSGANLYVLVLSRISGQSGDKHRVPEGSENG